MAHKHSPNNSTGDGWLRHPTQPNTFYNTSTADKAVRYLVTLTKLQENAVRKRIQQHHNFIIKILHCEVAQKNKQESKCSNFWVYVEKTYPISADKWVPVTSVLSILKGFRRLTSNYGPIKILPAMIRISESKDIRVWIHDDLIHGEPVGRAQSQESMLADIVRIVMEYDSNTGALMMNCSTINQAINNILHSLGQCNIQANFTIRTGNQPRASKQVEVSKHKTYFRSTKETEDDSLKIFQDHKTEATRERCNVESPPKKNYLENVTVPKHLNFITISSTKPPKPEQWGNKNTSQQSNNIQKQSSTQFNSSQPSTKSSRPYKPIEHKAKQTTANYQQPTTMSSQIAHSFQHEYSKYGEGLPKPPELSPHERRSNLNRNYLERIEVSQETQFGSNITNKGSGLNDKSDFNTSREFFESYNSNRQRQPANYDPIRTKTQQFYNTDGMAASPRIRTNILQIAHMQKQTPTQLQNNIHPCQPRPHYHSQIPQKSTHAPINHTPIQIVPLTSTPTQMATSPHAQPPHAPSTNVPSTQTPTLIQVGCAAGSEVSQFQPRPTNESTRSQQKRQQAQRIKQEMNGLGIMNSSSPRTLNSEKSARDLLIKQKIEEKSKKMEQVKCAITRLLSE